MSRELVDIPTCPFCGVNIEKPQISGDDPDITLGRCSCGAVYACDESGKNLGSAFVEALLLACNKDWDMAWNLSEDKDFKTEIVKHYDPISHLIVPGGVFDKRRIVGALYFIRLHNPLIKTKKSSQRNSSIRTKPDIPFDKNLKIPLSKDKVEELIANYDLQPIIKRASSDKKIIKNLQRLLYSADPVIRARAAEALGKACAIISKDEPKKISRLVQTLLYSLIDTAAFSVGAFEAIAEIIVNAPDLYESYIPYLYQLISEESRRGKTIMALARIAEVKPNLLRSRAFYFLRFLKDKDPETRGYTVILLGNLKASELKEDIAKLKGDMSNIFIYQNGNIISKTIDELVSIVINNL